MYPRKRHALFVGLSTALALAIAQGCAPRAHADQLDDQRAQAALGYQAQLAQLAEETARTGDAAAAEVIGNWAVLREPGRQYAFVPPTVPAEGSEAFLQLRAQRADELVQLAVAFAAGGREAEAFGLLCEALREDPDQAEARRVLGFRRDDSGAWLLTASSGQPQRGRGRPRGLTWQNGTYWEVDTDHYSIVSNATAQEAVELGQRLEELYWVWRQLFFDFTGDAPRLRAALAGGALRRAAVPKMRVVLFADRDEYVSHLQRWEPQIAVSQGLYRDKDETCYLYAGENAARSTWFHEATHQLFFEAGPSRRQIGEEANMWLVEGVAIYMESLAPWGSYFTVGGFDAPRLQVARYRLLNERYYVPLAQLVIIGREQLKQHQDVRRLYTESAGIAHYLLDGEGGRYRPAVLELLQQVYAGRDEAGSLEAVTGADLETLDAGYAKFLIVTDADMARLLPPSQLGDLCLGHSEVTDAGLAHLAGYTLPGWIDLAYCRVGDDGVANLANCRQLVQLNLEGTGITDEALKTVGQLTQLEHLDLSQTEVTDDGLAQLVGLANLKTLWLTGTGVTNAGLAHLAGMRDLEYLNVNGTQVTTAGLAALEEHLPKLNREE